MSTTTFSVRPEEEMKEQILRLAHSTGRSANFLFNEALHEDLERECRQLADIEQGSFT